MIYLHTGLPGAGKTLFTLHLVRERAKAENRTVYYAGIEIEKPEEFPGWERLADPERWFELPDGAIIVHDECQTLYRPRATGSKVPEYVAKFETHRHKGHDVYLITQHPMLVDGNVRRLAGEHCHVVRSFGAQVATLHRWAQVNERCDKSRKDSVAKTARYPAELFGAYKSATVHTHKRRLPARLWFLVALPILLGACVWLFSSWLGEREAAAKPEAVTSSGMPTTAGPAAPRSGTKTAAQWLADQQPRIAGLPHTAPLYDKVTEVVRAPFPAACVASKARCTCYTQQGTVMTVDDGLCRQIVERGYFVAWDVEERRDGARRRATAEPAHDEAPGAERFGG